MVGSAGTLPILPMVLTVPAKQNKAWNFTVKVEAMKKPGILLVLASFHENNVTIYLFEKRKKKLKNKK